MSLNSMKILLPNKEQNCVTEGAWRVLDGANDSADSALG